MKVRCLNQSHLTDSEAWRVVGRLEGGQVQAEAVQAIGMSCDFQDLEPNTLKTAAGTTVSTQTVRNQLMGDRVCSILAKPSGANVGCKSDFHCGTVGSDSECV
ncbi:hypothetical protein TNCV_1174111 [Trichonephila clavipes]|nr:hypothetical protein TNCV_1174111 [Trichonephila clavipes]